jgi:hypothetical protein
MLKSQLTPRKDQSKKSASLRVARQSGAPLDPNHIKLYNQDFALLFDSIQEKLHVTDATALTEEQANLFNQMLEDGDKQLREKYPAIEHWHFLSYGKMQRKIKFYGCPIMVSVEASSGNLCYILVDEETQPV